MHQLYSIVFVSFVPVWIPTMARAVADLPFFNPSHPLIDHQHSATWKTMGLSHCKLKQAPREAFL